MASGAPVDGMRPIIGKRRNLRYDLDMEQEQIIKCLRAATEDDVARACADSYVNLDDPSPAYLLEFFNRMIDVLIGEEDD